MPRQKFSLPTSMREAEDQRAQLLAEIESVDRQLQDPSRDVDATWRSRAEHAKWRKMAQVRILDKWIQRPTTSKQIVISNKKVAQQLAVQDAQMLQYLDLLRRCQALFQTLRAEDVEFDPTEDMLLQEIDDVLDSRRSAILAEARACVSKAKNHQDAVESLSRLVVYTKDQGDLELLKAEIVRWQAVTKDKSGSESLWLWVIRAFLACGDVSSAVYAAMEQFLPGRAARTRGISLVYAQSRDPSHLQMARARAVELETFNPEDCAMGWVEIYVASHAPEDLARAKEFFAQAIILASVGNNRAGLQLAFIRKLCEAGNREEADQLLREVRSPIDQVEGFCALGNAFHDVVYLNRAVAAATQTGLDALPFKTFSRLVRLCASLGDVGRIKALSDSVKVPVARCYALSIAAAVQTKENRVTHISEASTAFDQAYATGTNAHLDPTRLAFIWALTAWDRMDRAMSIAKGIGQPYTQCRALLLIDAAQNGRVSIDDLAH